MGLAQGQEAAGPGNSQLPQGAGGWGCGGWGGGGAVKKKQREKIWKLITDSTVDLRSQRKLGRSFNLLSPEENHITRKRLWEMTGFGLQAGVSFFLEFSKRWDRMRPKRALM